MRGKGKVLSDLKLVQRDQALVNQRILSQLGGIGKHLSVIENSASAAQPKPQNSVCDRTTAGSSLPASSREGNMHTNLPDLHTLRHERFIQEQVEDRIR